MQSSIKMQRQELTFVWWSVILLISTIMVACETSKKGRCPTAIKTVKNFNATRYLGTWYEFAKYPIVAELGYKCIKMKYCALSSGNFSVRISQISTANKPLQIRGTAQIVGPAKFFVSFNDVSALVDPANYWILNSDYKKYSVLYSCTNIGGGYSQFVWILTRDRYPSLGIVQKAKDVILKANLSWKALELTDQKNCK